VFQVVNPALVVWYYGQCVLGLLPQKSSQCCARPQFGEKFFQELSSSI